MASGEEATEGPFTPQFCQLVAETLAEWHVPGMSMAVLDRDNTWTESFGTATFPSTPVHPETLFYVGSTTKAFTAAAVALMVEDDERYLSIQWTTPVRQILPDIFELKDEYISTRVTIEDLLSHRSGLARHDNSYGRNQQGTSLDVVKSVRHLPLTAGLRSKFQYCNVMLVVAAHIVQVVSGQTFGDFLRDRIWQPLEMHRTYIALKDVPEDEQPNLAAGYHHDGTQYKQVTWMPLEEIAGAGAMISNVQDYIKWTRALLNQTGPLTPAVCKAILEPPHYYWHMDYHRGQRVVHHGGRTQAYGAELFILPELDYAIIMFGNTLETSNNAELALVFHLIDEKLAHPVELRFDWSEYGCNIINKRQEALKTARSVFYPSVPTPSLGLPVPLTSFVGTYTHPGYQELTIFLANDGECLRADRDKMTWPQFMRFEHITGLYFLAYFTHIGQMAACFPSVYPVEFHVGSDGHADSVGVRWEEEMKDEKIWFERVVT